MTVFEKLAKKIKDELGYEVTNLERTRAGYWQLGGGAFTWVGTITGLPHGIGSSEIATDLIKSKYKLIEGISFGGSIEVFGVLHDNEIEERI